MAHIRFLLKSSIFYILQGQRALDFVLRNQGLIDKTLLFDIELLKIVSKWSCLFNFYYDALFSCISKFNFHLDKRNISLMNDWFVPYRDFTVLFEHIKLLKD